VEAFHLSCLILLDTDIEFYVSISKLLRS